LLRHGIHEHFKSEWVAAIIRLSADAVLNRVYITISGHARTLDG
jgi:hypothetical protein